MKNAVTVLLLGQELTNDFGYFQTNSQLRARALQRLHAGVWDDELDLMVLGSCLHNFYNSVEAYFFRVAKFFENNIDQMTWHRDLLDRMALHVPGIRPALIRDPELVENLDELRRFRHLFRDHYKTRLRADRLQRVNSCAEAAEELFPPDHTRFIAWLNELARSLGD